MNSLGSTNFAQPRNPPLDELQVPLVAGPRFEPATALSGDASRKSLIRRSDLAVLTALTAPIASADVCFSLSATINPLFRPRPVQAEERPGGRAPFGVVVRRSGRLEGGRSVGRLLARRASFTADSELSSDEASCFRHRSSIESIAQTFR